MNHKLISGIIIIFILTSSICLCIDNQPPEPSFPPAESTSDSDYIRKPTSESSNPPAESMEKYVSPDANFVLYKPTGWTVQEDAQQGYYYIAVADPKAEYLVEMLYGMNQVGTDLYAIMRLLTESLRTQFPDFHFENTIISTDGNRIVFDVAYTDPKKGEREGKCWISINADNFIVSSCETPAGQFIEKRDLLLGILYNICILQGASPLSSASGTVLPLRQCYLSDYSASFSIPQDWSFDDFGKTLFTARDPTGQSYFMVANVELITPQLGVTLPNVPISPYLPPEQAIPFLLSQGTATDIQILEVIPRPDLDQQISQVYTAGPVTAEEILYAYTNQGTKCTGYTFGISFGSRVGTNWNFWHISVASPSTEFNAYLPTFVAMMQSYKISDQYAQNYIAQGMKRLQELQRETAQVVARTSEEISALSQAAYDERQRSQDYIDYQRTNYIRGEQDWISEMEGGTIYHTDSWGAKNTYTGETWEGAPFDYVHFKGENPKYREDMIPIDSREVYERVYG